MIAEEVRNVVIHEMPMWLRAQRYRRALLQSTLSTQLQSIGNN